MELNLNGDWYFAADNQNIGENQLWNHPAHFPNTDQTYRVPSLVWNNPINNLKQAWLRRLFNYQKGSGKYIFLVFFGADNGKIWLNGYPVGELKRLSGKQVFDVTKFLKDENELIIKFEDIRPETMGLWKNVYLLEDTSVPDVAKSPIRSQSKWLKQVVLYMVDPRLFSSEGNFKGLIDRIPYLKSLGVNTLLIFPIQPVKFYKGQQANKIYSIRDFYEIDSNLGTKEEFKQLVNAAHKAGIKVILEISIGHTTPDSPLLRNDPKFYKNKADFLTKSWHGVDLRELDYSHSPARDYIREMLAYWVREFGIDGYQFDYSFMIPMDFWKGVIPDLRLTNPDLVLAAEGENPDLYNIGFDMVSDWHFASVMDRIQKNYYDFEEICNYINTQFQYFPIDSKRLFFLKHHFTENTSSPFSKDMLVPVNVIKFFAPGIPMIYAGEEFGLEGMKSIKDDDWPVQGRKPTYFDFYREMLSLRKSALPLQAGGADSFSYLKGFSYFEIVRTYLDKSLHAVFDLNRDRVTILKNRRKFKTIYNKI